MVDYKGKSIIQVGEIRACPRLDRGRSPLESRWGDDGCRDNLRRTEKGGHFIMGTKSLGVSDEEKKNL